MIAKKVLIVDDNTLNRRVFEHIVGQVYQIESVENGKMALDMIKKGGIDLILMDIQMPTMDGINTMKTIKSSQLTKVPVIAVSAYASESDKDYFLSTGFDDFVPKPIHPRILLETIDRLLKSKTSQNGENESLAKPTPILDVRIVNQLLKFNSAANIKKVYEEFIDESEGLMQEIRSAIEHEQYREIGEKLHIIKGNSGTLGALRVFKHCQKFEKHIKDSNFDNTAEDYLSLAQLLDDFKSTIQSSKELNA